MNTKRKLILWLFLASIPFNILGQNRISYSLETSIPISTYLILENRLFLNLEQKKIDNQFMIGISKQLFFKNNTIFELGHQFVYKLPKGINAELNSVLQLGNMPVAYKSTGGANYTCYGNYRIRESVGISYGGLHRNAKKFKVEPFVHSNIIIGQKNKQETLDIFIYECDARMAYFGFRFGARIKFSPKK
jgi:hypothetical protein